MSMGASGRSYGGVSADQRRADRRTRLLEVGRELWCEQGWAAVTMRGVCARAGITDRYFYESFADKDALLVAVAEDVRTETLALVMDTYLAQVGAPPVEQLRVVLTAVVDFVAGDPGAAQIFFGDHGGSEVLVNMRHQTIASVVDLFVEVSKPLLLEGALESDLQLAVLLGIGGFVEIAEAWRAGTVSMTAQELVDSLVRLALRMGTGLLALD